MHITGTNLIKSCHEVGSYLSELLARYAMAKECRAGSYSLMSKMRYGSLHSSITNERERLRWRGTGGASEKVMEWSRSKERSTEKIR